MTMAPQTKTDTPMTDAELRAIRENLGMPIRELAQVLQVAEDVITSMEHGNIPVGFDIETKLAKVERVTDQYLDRLAQESKARGFIETYRFNAEMAARVPEFSSFGSMWHRNCALRVQYELSLPLRYPARAQRVVI